MTKPKTPKALDAIADRPQTPGSFLLAFRSPESLHVHNMEAFSVGGWMVEVFDPMFTATFRTTSITSILFKGVYGWIGSLGGFLRVIYGRGGGGSRGGFSVNL